MGRQHILVIDDERDILELLKYNLQREDYEVSCSRSGEEGLQIARIRRPDLIVLDLMLPGMDGFQVCAELKKDSKTEDIPVIMLTARSEETDMLSGFEKGADNYVLKPFSPRVLIARIKAVLRSRKTRSLPLAETLEVHNVKIHCGRHEVLLGDQSIDLTSTEFRILRCLASQPGWVFSRHQIVNLVQGDDVAVTDRSIDVHIVSLRKKFGEHGNYIETVRGVGYRFRENLTN